MKWTGELTTTGSTTTRYILDADSEEEARSILEAGKGGKLRVVHDTTTTFVTLLQEGEHRG